MIKKSSRRLPRIITTTSILFLASSGNLFAAESNALKKYILDGGPTMIFIGLAILALIALCVFQLHQLDQSKIRP